jgi:ribosome-associated toxin RatA of RatAB toxin-antitoxin module
MRSVHITFTVPARSLDEVYATLADFEQYPRLSPAVREVSVVDVDADTTMSRWEVNFRNGILRWTEEDTFDRAHHRIDFRQLDGDIAAFDGSWSCTNVGDQVTVEFAARVDLGIPSLADALEPIATRTLIANTIAIVTGLFGPTVQVDATGDEPAVILRKSA